MSLNELLPALHHLPRPDKFRVLQLLTAELAQEEDRLAAGAEYSIWSPHDADEAAATLTQYLQDHAGK